MRTLIESVRDPCPETRLLYHPSYITLATSFSKELAASLGRLKFPLKQQPDFQSEVKSALFFGALKLCTELDFAVSNWAIPRRQIYNLSYFSQSEKLLLTHRSKIKLMMCYMAQMQVELSELSECNVYPHCRVKIAGWTGSLRKIDVLWKKNSLWVLFDNQEISWEEMLCGYSLLSASLYLQNWTLFCC